MTSQLPEENVNTIRVGGAITTSSMQAGPDAQSSEVRDTGSVANMDVGISKRI